LNIIPLIMIPNIILGGALIKYEEMNRGLDLIHSIRRFLGPNQDSAAEKDSKLQVPAICQLMPLRWSYEAIIIAHAERNPVSALINDIEAKLDSYKKLNEAGHALSPKEEAGLDAAKDALAIVYGLDGRNADDVRGKIAEIRTGLTTGKFNPAEFMGDSAPGETVTAEQLYLNEKVLDLFNRAEVERRDYRRGADRPNVFFGKEKRWQFSSGDPENGKEPTAFHIPTLVLNAIVLLLFSLLGLVALHTSLKRQMRKV
ncbi:MAG: hypothetical protein KDL87_03680, partial [Verrucomicrobiae bacterium]|nr:hypothetical protein [Verrucomicrobiae bacterium]